MPYCPIIKHASVRSNSTDHVDEHIPKESLKTFFGYSDSEWAMYIRHRLSISGMVFFLAGAMLAWNTQVQLTVALSTTDSEFLSASDSGRHGLFIRAVLGELRPYQVDTTYLYEDSKACILVANYSAPKRQIWHISICDSTLQYWTECNIIALLSCSSNKNLLTCLQNRPVKFYLHATPRTFMADTHYFRSVERCLIWFFFVADVLQDLKHTITSKITDTHELCTAKINISILTSNMIANVFRIIYI
jgi:hypothetical protein